MPQKVRIALDAMGGDHGPSVVVPGAADRARPSSRQRVHPVRGPGQDRAAVERAIPGLRGARLVHTDVAVRMDDKPSQALRNGRWKSSMWLAIDAVKKGEADIAVSAGNTGALMAMAKFHLKTMPGIDRPAIAAIWPTIRGRSIVLDLGASIGADAEQLVQLAVMGSAMARALFGLDRPKVGLLNIGVEEVKGLEPIREAAKALREEAFSESRLFRFCRRRRHRQRHGRRGGDRRIHRQHRAQDRGGHRAAVCRLPQGRNEPFSAIEDRVSAGERRIRTAAREDGPAARPTAASSSVSTAS